jgi:hypothetical protein
MKFMSIQEAAYLKRKLQTLTHPSYHRAAEWMPRLTRQDGYLK